MADRNKNDELTDEQLIAAIVVLATSERLGRRAIDLLNDSEPRIAALIRNTRTGLTTSADFKRMQALIERIKRVRSKAWREIETEVMDELRDLAREQPEKMQDLLEKVDDSIVTERPGLALLASIPEKRPFEGRTMREWLAKQEEDDLARITNQVRFGMVSRETPDRITQRVFGEARVLGANGATEEARRRLFEIVVMGGLFAGNEAKREFVNFNPDSFGRELYLAVLDERTTKICRSLNKKVFKVGEGPYPPIHFWCRSIRVFLLPGELPRTITSLASWLEDQPASVRKMVDAFRAERFKRS